MRTTRKNQRKALVALALGFATAAIFATTASAKPAQSSEISYLSWGATADDLGPFKAQKAISYLSWGATGDDRGPFVVQRVETPYLSWGATAADLSPFTQQNLSGGGVTPTNLARASHGDRESAVPAGGTVGEWQISPTEAAKVGVGPAFESKTVESASVSASSDSLERGDLALGFGLGLILATAGAIALAMTRDRQHSRVAHS
jgi:hypothetical protein